MHHLNTYLWPNKDWNRTIHINGIHIRQWHWRGQVLHSKLVIFYYGGFYLKMFCRNLEKLELFHSQTFYAFPKVMGWLCVIIFSGPHSIGNRGNAFWGRRKALVFIKWLWTLRLEVLTLHLPLALHVIQLKRQHDYLLFLNMRGCTPVSPVPAGLSLSAGSIWTERS